MNIILTIIIFIALAVNIPLLIALFVGLNLSVTNATCKDEVEGVKKNVNTIKVVIAADVVLFLTILILL